MQVGREWCWLYAAVDLESKLLLGVRLSRWRAACPASAFLRELKEQHELEETEFLVDAMGYRTALVRTDLGGRVEYRYRNLIEKWFQTLKMRVERFHTVWNGEAAYAHYYNFQRPNQALDDHTPAEVVA